MEQKKLEEKKRQKKENKITGKKRKRNESEYDNTSHKQRKFYIGDSASSVSNRKVVSFTPQIQFINPSLRGVVHQQPLTHQQMYNHPLTQGLYGSGFGGQQQEQPKQSRFVYPQYNSQSQNQVQSKLPRQPKKSAQPKKKILPTVQAQPKKQEQPKKSSQQELSPQQVLDRQLWVACQKKDITLFKQLIEKGANTDQKIAEGVTLLHYAAVFGSLPIVSYLIEEKGFDVNIQDIKGRQPIDGAVLNEYHADVVEYLLSKGATKTKGFLDNCQCYLKKAFMKNDLETFKKIVSQGGNPGAVVEGRTYLHFATSRGYMDFVKYFCDDLKMNIDIVDSEKNTPLYYAASKGLIEVVMFLVKSGAKVFEKNNKGEVVYFFIKHFMKRNSRNRQVREKYQAILQMILKNAFLRGDLAEFKKIVADGVQPSGVDAEQRTYLHLAADKGYLPFVQYFCNECTMGINIKDNRQNTPLHYAVLNGHLDVISFFIEKEAKVDEVNNEGKSACFYIKEQMERNRRNQQVYEKYQEILQTILTNTFDSGDLEAFKKIVAYGANPSGFVGDQTKERTYLHYAAYSGSMSFVRYFCDEHTMTIDMKDNRQNTPLHYAVHQDKLDVISFLIEKGANVDEVNDQGKSVCFYIKEQMKKNKGKQEEVYKKYQAILQMILTKAFSKCDLEAFKKIVSYGANPSGFVGNQTKKRTYLHWAVCNGNMKFVTYLCDDLRVDIDIKDYKQNMPLHYAVFYRHLDIIRFLIEKGAKVYEVNYEGKSACLYIKEQMERNREKQEVYKKYQAILQMILRNAFFKRDLETFKEIVSYGVNSFGIVGDETKKRTYLHLAAGRGYVEFVQYLCDDLGLDIHIKDYKQNTPLHHAVFNGHLDVLSYLIARGAKVYEANSAGEAAYSYIKEQMAKNEKKQEVYKKYQTILYEIEKQDDMDVLISGRFACAKASLTTACYYMDFPLICHLVEHLHRDVNEKRYELIDYSGGESFTYPLHEVIKGFCSNEYRQDRVSEQVPFGQLSTGTYSINMRGGRTPRFRLQEICCYLLSKGANINVKDDQGNTALHYAVLFDDLKLATFLVETCNANVNVVNANGLAPIAMALQKEKKNIIAYFASKKANGISPLHVACYMGNIGEVRNILNENGELLNKKDGFFGFSPLHLAVYKGHFDIVKLLVGHDNAEVNSINIQGYAPYDICVALRSGRNHGDYLNEMLLYNEKELLYEDLIKIKENDQEKLEKKRQEISVIKEKIKKETQEMQEHDVYENIRRFLASYGARSYTVFEQDTMLYPVGLDTFIRKKVQEQELNFFQETIGYKDKVCASDSDFDC